MPRISGPQNLYDPNGTGEPLQSEARTLGEAIKDYEVAYRVSVRPAPASEGSEPKYFLILEADGITSDVVDIHVVRNDEEICPKQDLAFALLPDDEVVFGVLAC
jgi:hypothetical protein